MEIDLTKTLDFIIKYEGLKLKAYRDSAGILTIGCGTTRINGEKITDENMTCTEEQARQWLTIHVMECFEFLNICCQNRELNKNQVTALVSLIYNIGSGHFQSSTLLDMLNDIDKTDVEISNEFRRWNKIKGEVSLGLAKRRNDEAILFLS